MEIGTCSIPQRGEFGHDACVNALRAHTHIRAKNATRGDRTRKLNPRGPDHSATYHARIQKASQLYAPETELWWRISPILQTPHARPQKCKRRKMRKCKNRKSDKCQKRISIFAFYISAFLHFYIFFAFLHLFRIFFAHFCVSFFCIFAFWGNLGNGQSPRQPPRAVWF